MEREKNAVDTLPQRAADKPSQAGPDLSLEIARAVKKQPGDRVKCRRISSATYRVNWFAPDRRDQGEGFALDSYHIRDSRFLRVRKVDGELVIEDLTGMGAGDN